MGEHLLCKEGVRSSSLLASSSLGSESPRKRAPTVETVAAAIEIAGCATLTQRWFRDRLKVVGGHGNRARWRRVCYGKERR